MRVVPSLNNYFDEGITLWINYEIPSYLRYKTTPLWNCGLKWSNERYKLTIPV